MYCEIQEISSEHACTIAFHDKQDTRHALFLQHGAIPCDGSGTAPEDLGKGP